MIRALVWRICRQPSYPYVPASLARIWPTSSGACSLASKWRWASCGLIAALHFHHASANEFNVRTIGDQVAILSALATTHPNAIAGIIEHGGAPAHILGNVSVYLSRVEGATLNLPDQQAVMTRLAADLQLNPVFYDPAGISSIVQRLMASHALLRSKLGEGFTLSSLDQDLRALKNSPASIKVHFLSLSPFFYDAQGAPLVHDPFVDNHFRTHFLAHLSSEEIESGYFAKFEGSLRPIVAIAAGRRGLGAWSEALGTYDNKFIRDFLRPQMRLRSGTDRDTKIKTVALEQIPPAIALFRGAIGYDCSSGSVAHYPLHPRVKTFLIRTDGKSDSPPKGYVLVAEVQRGESVVPYVLTINGPTLSVETGRLAVYQIAAIYGSDRILAPTDALFVNSALMRQVLYWDAPRAIGQIVNLPAHWGLMDMQTKALGQIDHYRTDRAANAREVLLDAAEMTLVHQTQKWQAPSRYYERADLTSQPPLIRAILAGRFAEASREEDLHEIAHALALSRDQVAAARALFAEFGRVKKLSSLVQFLEVFQTDFRSLLQLLDLPTRRSYLTNYRVLGDRDRTSAARLRSTFTQSEEIKLGRETFATVFQKLNTSLDQMNVERVRSSTEMALEVFHPGIDAEGDLQLEAFAQLRALSLSHPAGRNLRLALVWFMPRLLRLPKDYWEDMSRALVATDVEERTTALNSLSDNGNFFTGHTEILRKARASHESILTPNGWRYERKWPPVAFEALRRAIASDRFDEFSAALDVLALKSAQEPQLYELAVSRLWSTFDKAPPSRKIAMLQFLENLPVGFFADSRSDQALHLRSVIDWALRQPEDGPGRTALWILSKLPGDLWGSELWNQVQISLKDPRLAPTVFYLLADVDFFPPFVDLTAVEKLLAEAGQLARARGQQATHALARALERVRKARDLRPPPEPSLCPSLFR